MTRWERVRSWAVKWLLGRPRRRSPIVTVLLWCLHLSAVLVLLLALLAAVVSRQISPFYGWVEGTRLDTLGQYLVGFVNQQDLAWRRRVVQVPLLNDEAEARKYLEDEIQRLRPTHTFLLRNGTVLFGRVRDEAASPIVAECDTDRGPVTVRLQDRDIKWQKKMVYPAVELFPEDVRFLLNFPGYGYYYLPPYLIVSDAPYPYVQFTYDMLNDLSADFSKRFHCLLASRQRSQLAYVCFFRDEQTYLRFAIQKEDVDLETSVGFYSQQEGCLFVYDRLRSFARGKIDRLLADWVAERQNDTAAPPAQVERLAREEQERSYQMLMNQMVTTLRHEGAHQIAFSQGIHTAQGLEHLWVQEGLAQYCETVPIGEPIAEKLELLRDAQKQHTLVPWQELVEIPASESFGAHTEHVAEAYAQTWLMFYHLMQPGYRMHFMMYLQKLHRVTPGQMAQPDAELLAKCMEMSFLDLARELSDRIRGSGSTQEPVRPVAGRSETR